MGAVMGGGRGIFVVVVFVVVGGVGVCVCVGCEAGEEGFERCDVVELVEEGDARGRGEVFFFSLMCFLFGEGGEGNEFGKLGEW